MNFIGDNLALGLVIVLFMFYFASKSSLRYLSVHSKIYIATLVMTALTAVTDIITGYLLRKQGVPMWQNMLANTAYFIFSILTTSLIALYLFTKILEHTHERHCMRRAYIALTVLFGFYLII